MVSPQRRIQYVSVHILLEGVRGCKGSEKQPVFLWPISWNAVWFHMCPRYTTCYTGFISVMVSKLYSIRFQYTLKVITFFLFLNYFIVVQLQLSAFSPHHCPHPSQPTSLASTLPLGFVHVSFIVVPSNPFPHYPTSPLVTVRLFLISMSLVIFCLLFSFDE